MTSLFCDGVFEFNGTNVNCTMGLHRNKENIFTVNFKNAETIICSEYLTKKKSPYFDSKSFYVLGRKIFTTEEASSSRFNDIKKYFEAYFDVKIEKMFYDGHWYLGEMKDNVPNGYGVLYYGNTNNMMIKSTFVNGKLDGQTVLYSKDQSIEIICDDVVNMHPVQYATVLFKNAEKESLIDMADFNQKHKENICFHQIDKFVNLMANFAIMNDSSIIDVKKFLFSNKTQQQQYEEIFNLLNENNNTLVKFIYRCEYMFKIFGYLLVLYFPFFIFLLCNMK